MLFGWDIVWISYITEHKWLLKESINVVLYVTTLLYKVTIRFWNYILLSCKIYGVLCDVMLIYIVKRHILLLI